MVYDHEYISTTKAFSIHIYTKSILSLLSGTTEHISQGHLEKQHHKFSTQMALNYIMAFKF